MGFDIECIVNIQSYPGEYFCPVCRTLVYPNEAIQAQCTHLYCKPCLTYVANTTKACPYDQYLVTEADAKPLIESDKALAENIGKVKVQCMFQRSGCTWEGTLSESASHCSGCTFGNSSVICNRCGIQILHRQVHDHAQTCSGTYQAPQAFDANQNAASSSVTASTTYVEQNHAVALSGPSTSQTQISQTSAAPLPSGQGPTQQATAGSQAVAVAPSATPTSDQWYQHQYYQQQYPGYNPYQQSYQQYYPYPQPVVQTQQQGQYNSQAYVQPHPQPQAQAQLQSYPVHQVSTQPQTQPPVVVQGTNQLQAQVQSAASHYQQVNPQQQFSQPQPQQYAQVPGYQQPVQSTYPAIPSQNNTQPQSLPQAQIQPHYPLQHQSLPYSQQYPQQVNQPPVPNVHPHGSHSANAVVTGHQSYQPPQQVPMAPLQQLAVPSSHIPQQPPSARPPLSDGLVANQQKSAVSAHMPNNHPTQLQQLHPRAHTPASLVQHNPGIQSIQQSMPQQSQAFHAPFQGLYSQIRQQMPLQSQLRPQGPPHGMQTGGHGHNPSQKNTPLVPGFIPQQPQNYGAQQPMPAVGGFAPPAPNKPGPHGSNHSSANNNFAKRESNSPGHLQSKKDAEAGNTGTHAKTEKELVEESREGSGSNRIVVNDADKDVNTGESSDAPSAGKPLRTSAVGENIDSGVRKEFESFSNQKDSIMENRDSQSTNLSASNANGSDKLADRLKSQSLHSSGLPGFSPSSLTRQRPDHLPPHAPISGFPGPGSTASYGRGRGSFLPPDSADPRSGGIGRTSVLGPEGPLGHGATGMDPSLFGLGNDRDGTMGPPSRFMPPPPRPDIPERVPQFGVHDGFRGKAGVTHAADFLKPNTGYGRNHGMPPHDREYAGMPPHESHAFGVRPRPFNLPPDSVGGSLHENMFPGLPSNMQRIEHVGTDHLRYGEHITPGHRHNHLRSDPLEEEFLSGLSRRGHMSGPQNFPCHFHSGDAAGFGDFPGRGRMGEMGGGFLHHLSGRESFTGNFPDFPRPGETSFRSNYSRQGFADDRFYAAELGSFDKSRKRKPVSIGWCRICKIDCESVEGLDMHSQTREHQRTALDIVKIIKQQNKKNIKMPGDRALTLEASKARNSDFDGRGSKP